MSVFPIHTSTLFNLLHCRLTYHQLTTIRGPRTFSSSRATAVTMSSQDHSPIGKLPAEMIMSIAEHLDPVSTSHLSKVCKGFNQALQPILKQAIRSHAFPDEEHYKFFEPVRNAKGLRLAGYPSTIPHRENLVRAIKRYRPNVVEFYLRAGVDPNAYSLTGERMLNLAICACHGSIAEMFLRYGADPCLPNINDSESPLSLAANHLRTPRYCPTALVTRLIEAGANPRSEGTIHSIVKNCQLRTVQLAVKHGADLYQINRMGFSTLHYANDMDKLNYILRETGNDLLPRLNISGETALSQVISSSNESVALALYSAYIASGHAGLLNIPDSARRTPLNYAIRKGMSNLATEMINSDAIVLAPNGSSGTELHDAVTRELIPIIRLLISKGVDVNARGRGGCTALYLAAWLNRPSLVRILIEEGNADVNIPYKWFTPLSGASAIWNEEVVEILQQYPTDTIELPSDPIDWRSPSPSRYLDYV